MLTATSSTTILSFDAGRSCVLSFSPSLVVSGAHWAIRSLRLKRLCFSRFTHINYSALNLFSFNFCSLFSDFGFQFSMILNVKWSWLLTVLRYWGFVDSTKLTTQTWLLTVIIFLNNNSWIVVANWSELFATEIRRASFLSEYRLIF